MSLHYWEAHFIANKKWRLGARSTRWVLIAVVQEVIAANDRWAVVLTVYVSLLALLRSLCFLFMLKRIPLTAWRRTYFFVLNSVQHYVFLGSVLTTYAYTFSVQLPADFPDMAGLKNCPNNRIVSKICSAKKKTNLLGLERPNRSQSLLCLIMDLGPFRFACVLARVRFPCTLNNSGTVLAFYTTSGCQQSSVIIV